MRILTVLFLLLSAVVLRAATLGGHGEIIVEPEPQRMKVMRVTFDAFENKAFVYVSKACVMPGPTVPSGRETPTETKCDPKQCPGCNKPVKVALDLTEPADTNLYSTFLVAVKTFGPVELLVKQGKVASVSLVSFPSTTYEPGPVTVGPGPVPGGIGPGGLEPAPH